MKAAVYYGPRDVRMEEIENPTIADNEILMNVKACGICGSDLHMYKQGMFSEMLTKPLNEFQNQTSDFPDIESTQIGVPGHEFSGEIVKVGKKIKNYQTGNRIVALNRGGMAEYAVIPVDETNNIYKIPEGVSYEEAATLEPLANSIHATNKGKPSKGENIVIFGLGAIGLGMIQYFKAAEFNINKIIAVDMSDYRLNTAKKMGADEIINPKNGDPVMKVFSLVGNDEANSFNIPAPKVDLIYDCVGYIRDFPEPSVLQQAINLARAESGRIVTHGIFEDPLTIQFLLLVAKQISIIGSFGMSVEDSLEAMSLMNSKKINRRDIITHEFSLDKVKQAFEMQCDIEKSIKVLVKP